MADCTGRQLPHGRGAGGGAAPRLQDVEEDVDDVEVDLRGREDVVVRRDLQRAPAHQHLPDPRAAPRHAHHMHASGRPVAASTAAAARSASAAHAAGHHPHKRSAPRPCHTLPILEAPSCTGRTKALGRPHSRPPRARVRARASQRPCSQPHLHRGMQRGRAWMS